MDTAKLASIVGLLIALSVASERLVEIVKGAIPPLNGKSKVPWKEGVRRTVLQVLAVVAGIITAFLARPTIPTEVLPATGDSAIFALGLLASGGSGFWNSVLTYVLKAKDIKEVEAIAARKAENLPVPAE
jgi:hypothetical protein